MREQKESNEVLLIEQNKVPVIFCEKLAQIQFNNDVVKMIFASAEGSKEGAVVADANLVMSFGDFIEYINTLNKFIVDNELLDKILEKNEQRKKELLELKNRTK